MSISQVFLRSLICLYAAFFLLPHFIRVDSTAFDLLTSAITLLAAYYCYRSIGLAARKSSSIARRSIKGQFVFLSMIAFVFSVSLLFYYVGYREAIGERFFGSLAATLALMPLYLFLVAIPTAFVFIAIRSKISGFR